MNRPGNELPYICNSHPHKMKYLFFTAALLLASASFAQQNPITFGVEGGISLANLTSDVPTVGDVYDSRTGYAAGLAFQYNFPKLFSFRTGIMYELKGAAFPVPDTSNPAETVEWLETMDYLTVPLLLRATFGDQINFFVNGGPYWALLLKRVQVLETASSYYSGQEIDLTDDTKNTEWGISIGAGAAVVLNERLVISLEARGNFGMTDIAPQTYMLKTRTYLLLAGVAFKFGSRENSAE
jgi:opacity protein-like surface antigen